MKTRERTMRRLLLFLAAAIGLVISASANAADWPTKPVRIIVPFAAGGAADTLGRLYADALSTAFGKQFYVENRVGAGGVIAAEATAHAEPDGYTLMVSGIPQVLAPGLNKNVGYDLMRDFTHIAYFGGAPNVFVVHPSFGVASLKDFLARAHGDSAGIEYVSAGVGTTGNMVGEVFAAKERIKLIHIAYKGGSSAIVDLIAGHVKVGMLTYSSIGEHIRAGNVIALATTSGTRLSYLPDVPTFKEAGYPELVATTWFSLSGPAGLPGDIVERTNREVVKAMALPQIRKQAEQDAVESKAMTPAETTQYIQSEIDKWQPILARMLGKK
jgi:tripartite-type tricarboxylate transporter receptor subunit TctC